MLQKAQLIAVGGQRRLSSLATLSAEQRYAEFARNCPVLVQRTPRYVIAYYLGMTRGFLFEIRNQRVSSKKGVASA